ncbi:MAG: hypothetical protein Mars2KO_16260 [Maribacter sp.]
MKMSITFQSLRRTIVWIVVLTCISSVAQTPDCTLLSLPADGSTDIPVDVVLEWPASANATGYRLTIGRSPGGNDVLDDFDVGNVTMYRPDGNLPSLRLLYVTIVPYNATDENTSCAETSFTTRSSGLPRCTEIINPFDGTELVPVNQNITWIRDFNATGYLMTIRIKDPNGIFLLNEVEVGNGTNFKPPDFEPRTKYYVKVIPFNDEGRAEDCGFISFTTGDGPPGPECPVLTLPMNNAIGVSPSTRIAWEEVDDVDGYQVTAGTTSGGGDIVNNLDVGNIDFITLEDELPKGARIYVKINSYSDGLSSQSCPISSFVVELISSDALKRLVPTFFTPNNDGFNYTWAINQIEDITVQKVSIFNRFGMLVKQMEGRQVWDGTLNGKSLPSDSYWYELDLLNAPKVKGYFLLKR